MEQIKEYIINHFVYFVIALCFIVLLIGISCYSAGQRAAERNAELQRIQSVEKQLEYTSTELTNAERANSTARNVIKDGIKLNNGISRSIDRSTEAVNRSENANKRTSDTITNAEQLVRDAAATNNESERIIRNSQSIIEAARARNKR